jgi:two-component system, NarL family, nitrate/nitrite response regulator NarL
MTVLDPRIDGVAGARLRDALYRAGLTRREYEVLRLVAAGHTNPEIAEELGLARNTVKTYLQTTMNKLGARNRVEAIAKASEARLL